MRSNATSGMVLIALFAATSAITSQINIPLPFSPIPINLALLSVFVAGGLLGSKNGFASQGVYLLLGALGLPIFAGFTGGIGVFLGPRGGFLVGYVLAAFLIGWMVEHTPKKPLFLILAMLAGLLICYIAGTAWFMLINKMPLLPALSLCVVPFIFGDILKIALAVIIVKRVGKVRGRPSAIKKHTA